MNPGLSEGDICTYLRSDGAWGFFWVQRIDALPDGRDALSLRKFDTHTADEVLREHAGSFVRRVWCVHCDGYTENVTQRVFDCPHCARTLVVRDHYSRRLAAFQAVKADAEVPGELPEAEELDT